MVNRSLSITSQLGIGSGFERANPILQLRELQLQINNPPTLSVGDRATMMRLLKERSEIQSGRIRFSTLKSELVTLNNFAQKVSATRLIEKASVNSLIGE